MTAQFNEVLEYLDNAKNPSSINFENSAQKKNVTDLIHAFRKVRNDAVSAYRKSSLEAAKLESGDPNTPVKVFTRHERVTLQRILKTPASGSLIQRFKSLRDVFGRFANFAEEAISTVNAERAKAVQDIKNQLDLG